MFKPKIVYQDKYLVVIDKPAGMVVNRAESVKGQTVQDWVESQSWWMGGDKEVVFFQRSGIAHRLDKETSGCLLIAKDPETLTGLLAAFKNRQVHKEYLALVHGRLEPKEGTIKLPIGRDRKFRKQRKVQVEGKGAETRWKVEKYLDKLTLVRLWPKTGRTHQIRVHLAHLGHPLVGDSLYLRKKQKALDRSWTDRHFLHAVSLSIKHPMTGEMLEVESQIPENMKSVELD